MKLTGRLLSSKWHWNAVVASNCVETNGSSKTTRTISSTFVNICWKRQKCVYSHFSHHRSLLILSCFSNEKLQRASATTTTNLSDNFSKATASQLSTHSTNKTWLRYSNSSTITQPDSVASCIHILDFIHTSCVVQSGN